VGKLAMLDGEVRVRQSLTLIRLILSDPEEEELDRSGKEEILVGLRQSRHKGTRLNLDEAL